MSDGRDVGEIERRLVAACSPDAHKPASADSAAMTPHQIMLYEAARDIAYLLQKVGELRDENDELRACKQTYYTRSLEAASAEAQRERDNAQAQASALVGEVMGLRKWVHGTMLVDWSGVLERIDAILNGDAVAAASALLKERNVLRSERDALRFCITEISEDCNETDWDRVAYQRAFELVGLRHPYCHMCRDQDIKPGRECPECGYSG